MSVEVENERESSTSAVFPFQLLSFHSLCSPTGYHTIVLVYPQKHSKKKKEAMLQLKPRGCRRSGHRGRRPSAALVAAAASTFLVLLLPPLLLLLPPSSVSASRPLSLPPLPFFEREQQRESAAAAGEKKPAAAAAAGEKELATPDPADHEASYGHFADLLASVLVLREGGVSEALDALPLLHDTTHAYVRTLEIVRAHERGDGGSVLGPAAAWRGLTDGAVRGLASRIPNTTKYSNYTDPLAAQGQQVQAALDEKWGPEPALGWERRWRWQQLDNAISKAIPDSTEEDQVIADLNAKLSQYNVEVSAKHVMEPSRFHNAAAVISKNIAGLHLMDSAFTFAPCLVSVHAAPLMVHGTGINVAPSAVGVMASGAMAWPQGVRVFLVLVLGPGPAGSRLAGPFSFGFEDFFFSSRKKQRGKKKHSHLFLSFSPLLLSLSLFQSIPYRSTCSPRSFSSLPWAPTLSLKVRSFLPKSRQRAAKQPRGRRAGRQGEQKEKLTLFSFPPFVSTQNSTGVQVAPYLVAVSPMGAFFIELCRCYGGELCFFYSEEGGEKKKRGPKSALLVKNSSLFPSPPPPSSTNQAPTPSPRASRSPPWAAPRCPRARSASRRATS